MLPEFEKRNFFKNGFVGPFKLYEPVEAKEILRQIRRANLDRSQAIYANNVNYDRHLDISALKHHILHPGIVSRIVGILGADVLCWRSEFFPKFPGDAATEWHQVRNYQYANGTPMLEPTAGKSDDITDLTVWTAFTDTTIQTACMRFIAGTHTKKYYDESKVLPNLKKAYNSDASGTEFYGYRFSEYKIDPVWFPEEESTVDIPMKAGECIIFTARCVHASHPNVSQTFTRFAISSRYVPTHVKVYPNTQRFYAHGAWFDLKDYKCMLVSGEDLYGHNKNEDESRLIEVD